MPFAICGVSEVPVFATIPLDHIISIRDHRQPPPDLRAFNEPLPKVHHFVFDDTGDSSNVRAPSAIAIQQMLAIYTTTTLSDRILFQCFAGVSRSSAAAFIWLIYHGVLWGIAYEMVVKVRGPFVCPNQLMVKHADTLMGCDGKLSAFLSAELGRRAPEREQYFRGCNGTVS